MKRYMGIWVAWAACMVMPGNDVRAEWSKKPTMIQGFVRPAGDSQEKVRIEMVDEDQLKFLRQEIERAGQWTEMSPELGESRLWKLLEPTKWGHQPWLGIQTQVLNDDLASIFNVKEGVVVTQVMEKSPAMKAGVKTGDVITHLDKTAVNEVGKVREEILKRKVGEKVALTIVRSGKSMTLDLRLARHGEAEPPVVSDNWTGLALTLVKDQLQVKDIEGGSPADEAGFEVGDRLVEFQGEPLKDIKGFETQMEKMKGKKALVLIERDGRRSFVVIKTKGS